MPRTRRQMEIELEALQSPDLGERRRAAEALGRLGPLPHQATHALLQTLRDSALQLQDTAMQAALQGQDAAIYAALQVQIAAVHSLGQLKETAALPAFCACLCSESDELRQAAARALEELGNPAALRALPLLEQALGNGDNRWPRLAAARALAHLGARGYQILQDTLQNQLSSSTPTERFLRREISLLLEQRRKEGLPPPVSPHHHRNVSFSLPVLLHQLQRHTQENNINQILRSLAALGGEAAEAVSAVCSLPHKERIIALRRPSSFYPLREICYTLAAIGSPAQEATPFLLFSPLVKAPKVLSLFMAASLTGRSLTERRSPRLSRSRSSLC